MSNPLDGIWAGDKLKRREEAGLLERFLDSEARALAAMGRDQAFVLALDAQYGEGKSWFLSRLRQQLAINYPVAFVDAWVDDANNEPLISIMAALDEALQPFLKKKNVREKLGALTRAALPIMGKAVLGAGGKLVAKYVGDEFGDEAKEAVAAVGKAKAATKKDDDDSPLEAGVEKLFEGVSEVVDNAGKALLDQYRARQRSREAFKENLRQLAASIQSTDEDPRHSPIFVIVDELDRCRPSYAISLLEEIKHLFDVPGVAFIIALHGDQLEASVKAVYGNEFSARSYLRRFFTRHYELRRLSIRELVAGHFEAIPAETKWSYPETWLDGKIERMRPADVAGGLLSEWGVTPREALAIIDALRLFVANWDHPKTPIELPLALKLLLDLVRGEEPAPKPMPTAVNDPEVLFVSPPPLQNHHNQPVGIARATELGDVYATGISSNLVQMSQANYNGGISMYISTIGRDELNQRFRGQYQPGREPTPTWREYTRRVKELGRFVEVQPVEEVNPLFAPGREVWS